MPDSSQPTLLNVDDTEVARYTKTRVLRHAGFTVLESATGQGALDTVERLRPALVLLDVRLPDINGTEVCRIIKRRWPSTMVLQTSATFVSPADRTRGLDGGADSYLIHPIDPDELVATTRALLRLHAAEEAARLLNESLEERIRVRTAELREANVKLVEQMAQRERAEEALVHAQKLEAVGQLTGAIAHDFNNLLAGLSGYVQLIDRLANDDKTRSMAKQALALVKRGSKLTGRLLNLVRTHSAHVEATDTRAVVEGMREWLAQTIGRAFTVTISTADEDLVALTDANELEFAILNMAINSRDAMPHGGPVDVAVQRRRVGGEGDADSIAASEGLGEGEYVVVSVSDKGHGMTDEVVQRAFRPFYSTKGMGRGTGLGLAQVHNLAIKSSGAARIVSTPGAGTLVELWLKAGTAAMLPATASTEAPTQPPTDSDPVHVVLVDDEPDVLLTVSALLTSNGYRVDAFGTGVEALAFMQETMPDALVSDISLLDMSGSEVAQRAKALNPELAVVFISGNADHSDLEGSVIGATLIRKPFSPAVLMNAVSTAVFERRDPQPPFPA